jgi:predicted lipoprotein with Yx(FWY)xxD motif
MRKTTIRLAAATGAALGLAGCGGATTVATNTTGGSAATQSAGSSVTVASATVSGHGLVLVAGFNKMTLYQFDMDVAGSGTSACTGGCIATWPPLTVPSGTTPTAATGITGQWGTLTRPDGKGVQVMYNGRPLYFYSGDTKPGDATGNYPHWSSVSATSGGAAAAPTTAAGTSNPYGY